ncbi:crocetin glucosyltransferase, chloroplastic-like [Cajanus cajan]|uniref:crocetin glucosyltransferase, chloroplastic-like n=1 Tax=Cajanus cajan TaxID=3821 RepID=UPI00098DAE6E|nr:crocetin glucosyltransferase, chloroplastic-like [Cajanus cajan]
MVLQRVLIVTYPAQSHINPALQLAKKLITMGTHVTLLLTLHLYRRITNKITIPGLTLLPFSDGHDAGFNTVHSPDADLNHYVQELKRRVSDFVSNLISTANKAHVPFTCLVYTLLLPCVADVARGLGLPTALFWIEPATVLDILYHYFHGRADYINEETKKKGSVTLPGLSFSLSARDVPSFLLRWKPVVFSTILPSFEEQILQLDMETNPTVLVNTFEALEVEALRAVDRFNVIPVIPIGPLIPSAFLDGKDPHDTSFGADIFPVSRDYVEWLDSKQENSVVYVSFGSYWELSKRQMEEIAVALLDCGRPFLWVIRKKVADGKEEEELEGLSCREELEVKGKIVTWCSQVEVLSHVSVGCFVTHCGWNSTMEGLVCGVPMVAFPQWTDQMTNAKMIEDVWKVGVRVDHQVNEDDGFVEGMEIKRCLEVVMGSGDKGNVFRNNAKKWKALARDAAKEGGPSENNLRAFLDDVGQKFMLSHVAEN